MLNKLAFRNAKRSIRDYMIYLITMTGIAALMYAFNSLLFCKEIMDLCTQSFVFGIMLGLATFFIILIMAWLINYMVRFMLEKRSREFGTYLVIGMRKKQVSRLYLHENVILGAVSFILGLLFGMFLKQILMTVFYRVFNTNYNLNVNFSIWCLLLTAICFFAAFVFALRKNRKLFASMQIIDFMHMTEKNETIEFKKQKREQFLFFPSLIYLIGFLVLVYRGHYQIVPTILAIIGFIAAIYYLYIGGSSYLMHYLEKKPASIYHGDHLFTLRQLSSKLKTMRFTFGTLTLLFTCALLGGSVAMMFSSYEDKALATQMPFDILIYSNNTEDTFSEELEAIEQKTNITDQYIYQVFQNGTTVMNDYLYTHNDTLGDKYKNADGTVNREVVSAKGYEYYDYDTFMKLSDYNRLREMLGLEAVTLSDDNYLIQASEKIVNDLTDFIDQNQGSLQIAGETLTYASTITDGFAQNGNNGADYILVIPDRYVQTMTPYFSDLAVSIEDETTVGLEQTLEDIHDSKNGILPEEEYDRLVEEGKIESDEMWDNTTLGGYGSNQIVAVVSDVLVSNEFGRDMRLAITSVVFPLAYIALVFVCAALTILAVQQLSDSAKYKFRYEVLRKLGMKERQLNSLVFRQLSLFYLLPVGVAVVLSGIISCFAGIQFVRYTAVSVNGVHYFLIALLIFLGVYLIYFIATYLGFCKNIKSAR